VTTSVDGEGLQGSVGDSAVTALVEARGLVKRFGHVEALAGADFDIRAGEVVALVGDNGAGKSTLAKVMAGALIADAGEVLVDGQLAMFRDPLDARMAGIETVYQDLALASALDVTSNLFLGREERRAGIMGAVFRNLDTKRMRLSAESHLAELGISLGSLGQLVETLSGGQRQAVAVARASVWGRRMLILDEPTASLGVHQTVQVLDLIRRMRDRGLAIVLISHNMPQAFEVSDRISVMRLGKRVAVRRVHETSMEEVVGMMTGAITSAA
jgi:fructose transport system ATP-binding protein